ELQTRLLRVLADGQFYRVGGQHALQSNVRVIAATHQDLEQRVHQGQFREDLFHRLNVIRLRLPALRERTEDIPLLARYFLQRSARDLGVEIKRLSEEALSALCAFHWPGNVRQLENSCHWISVMAPAQVVELKDLPAEFKQAAARAQAPSLGAAHALTRADAEPGQDASALQTMLYELDRSPENACTEGAPAGQSQVHKNRSTEVFPQASSWEQELIQEVHRLLSDQNRVAEHSELMDQLTRRFESVVIRAALRYTRGRRIDAASRLGIGRNTITRKIHELKLEDDHW
ncbi:MAG: nitrogen regulation protein NR(I), partial [Betaproteobacteria bacterium]|nr:nitrogen regulation protein NR(I) [Betaproteobacteria bacterium]